MIKVGMVGFGFMAGMHTQCYQATGEAQIAALVEIREEKRKEAEAKFGCKTYTTVADMLADADVDVVDVSSPTYCHEEGVVAAAKAGKHVFCEKPFGLTVESCDRMIDATEKAGVTLMLGQVLRFWPEYTVIKDIVDSGKFGKILWMSARRVSPAPKWCWDGWYFDPARSGGAVLDLHIHDQDFIRYLIGTPKQIQAVGVKTATGGLDTVQALGMQHDNGAGSYAEACLAMSDTYPFTMALLVVMEKGNIRLDSGLTPSLMVYPEQGAAYAPELPQAAVNVSTETSGNISSLGGYFFEIKHFVDCIKAGKKPTIVTPHDAREAVRMCWAVRNSVETGKVVDL